MNELKMKGPLSHLSPDRLPRLDNLKIAGTVHPISHSMTVIQECHNELGRLHPL